ncbi:MAG: ABC transporter ATP-binding protein [Oscillospiraceae bacterium]|nr:ABC transporter ATP-binding protein [Oscillospiraceae bacterium]
MANKNTANAPRPGGPGGPGRGPGGGGGGGRHAAIRGGEKPKDLKGTIKKSFAYLGIYKAGLALVMVLAALSSVFRVIGPRLLGNATDVLYKAVENGMLTGDIIVDYNALLKVVIALCTLYVISYVFNIVQSFTTAQISNNITYRMRKDISEKINRLPIGFFDVTSTGDVLSRITNDVESLSNSLRETLTQFASALTLMVGTIAMMLSISWELTLIAFAMIPVSGFIVAKIIKISQPLYRKQQKSLGMVNGHIEEMMSAHIVVKAFNMEQQSIDDFSVYNTELRENAWRSRVASSAMMPITNFVSNIGYILVCIIGATMAGFGKITVGNIQSFITYIRNFTQPIQQLSNISTMLQSAMACGERIFEFLDQPEEEPDTENPVSTEGIIGHVTFQDVNFGYTAEKTIIDDLDLEVHPGEKIAIVGPTGAGKTTVVKLLMRFYELNGGSISIDGINIKDFARNDLREMFGMVLQETWLFKGTIRENIMYSRPDASEEDMIRAAKASRVHHFVQTLPGGYDFELNEETSNISQGQKQLITIARAFLQNPKILILDEATSSVDTRTEVLIQQAMRKLMENRTSFVIAHRLSTIRDADKIIVLNAGHVEEVGNHHDLIEKGGFYAKLYQSQFENA